MNTGTAGEHRLTFELRDSTDRVRTHTQTLFVMQTGPVAIIDGLLDGQYIPPGSTITLDGSQSFDYDDDCLLYTSPSPRDRTRSRMPSSA